MTRPDGRAGYGDLQRRVLEIALAREACSVREVHDALGGTAAYTTVQTVMARLAERGTLARDMVGGVWRYRPAKSDDPVAADQLASQLISRYGSQAVTQFVQRSMADPELFEQLRRLVNDGGSDDA